MTTRVAIWSKPDRRCVHVAFPTDHTAFPLAAREVVSFATM